MSISNNKKATSYEPIVFLNAPIASDDTDVIGIESSVASVKTAINSGANMVGILADYGTGKSSVTEYLVNEEDEYHSININMWDCLDQKPSVSTQSEDISNLSKSFLYQLAVSVSEKRGSSGFAKHINKRLSRNYGLISFSIISGWQWFFLVIAALLYSLYQVLSNALFYEINKILNSEVATRWLIGLSPAFLVIAVVFLIWGIRKSSIAFSHWKDQSRRVKDVNDIFDIYDEIAKKLCNSTSKSLKHLIIVEDLDRIADKETIIGFLKEIYRFQNLLTKKQKERIVFIISVKPEALLTDSIIQERINKKVKEQTVTVSGEHTFDKLFDYTISLKPLHFEDYEAIILSIINSNSVSKGNLEKLLNCSIKDKLPNSFRYIIKGQNLTIRNLKNRLNQALGLMAALKNKKYKSQSNSAISFHTCAAVTYLELTYQRSYYETIKCEKRLAESIRFSYGVRNGKGEAKQKLEKLIENLTYLKENSVSEEYLSDLAQMILEGTIDDDFRMYLYNYPKGSYIKTSDEKDLSDLLLLPEEYSEDNLLDEKVKRITDKNKDRNIITECLQRLNEQQENIFPLIVTQNQYIFMTAMQINDVRTINTVNKSVKWSDDAFENSMSALKTISSFSIEVRQEFFKIHVVRLKRIILSFEEKQIIRIRLAMIELLGDEIIFYKKLFFPPQPHLFDDLEIGENEIPIVSEEELQLVSSVEIAIELINNDKVTVDSMGYIGERINAEKLTSEELKKAEEFYLSKYSEIDQNIIAPLILDFLATNTLVSVKLFVFTSKWIEDNLYEDEELESKFYNYINNIQEIPHEYLERIDQMCVYAGLDDEVLFKLRDNKLYATFLYSMCEAERLDEVSYKDDKTAHIICTACAYLNDTVDDEGLIIAIRLAILQNSAEKATNYMELFGDEYPLVSTEELLLIGDVHSVLPFISVSNISNDNYEKIIKYVNSKERSGEECKALFENLFIANTISDATVSKNIIERLDYSVVAFKDMTEEEKDEVVGGITGIMQLVNHPNCIRFMELTQSLVMVLEEITVKAEATSEYIVLINDLNQCTTFTVEWLCRQNVNFKLNSSLTEALLVEEEYESYLIGKTLFDEELTFNLDLVSLEYYINIYISTNEVFAYMAEDIDFLQAFVLNGDFDKLLPDRIMPLTKCRQPIELVKQAFQTMNPEQIEDYLYAFDHLDEESDSSAFLRYIKSSNNHEKLGTYKCRRRAWELLWKRGERQSFTIYMHRFYPNENYRITEEEPEFLD